MLKHLLIAVMLDDINKYEKIQTIITLRLFRKNGYAKKITIGTMFTTHAK